MNYTFGKSEQPRNKSQTPDYKRLNNKNLFVKSIGNQAISKENQFFKSKKPSSPFEKSKTNINNISKVSSLSKISNRSDKYTKHRMKNNINDNSLLSKLNNISHIINNLVHIRYKSIEKDKQNSNLSKRIIKKIENQKEILNITNTKTLNRDNTNHSKSKSKSKSKPQNIKPETYQMKYKIINNYNIKASINVKTSNPINTITSSKIKEYIEEYSMKRRGSKESLKSSTSKNKEKSNKKDKYNLGSKENNGKYYQNHDYKKRSNNDNNSYNIRSKKNDHDLKNNNLSININKNEKYVFNSKMPQTEKYTFSTTNTSPFLVSKKQKNEENELSNTDKDKYKEEDNNYNENENINYTKKNNFIKTKMMIHKNKSPSLSDITLNSNSVSEKKNKIFKTIKSSFDLMRGGLQSNGERKHNQDNYFFYNKFNSNLNHIYLGICDGHGQFGHDASLFLRNNLPFQMEKLFKNRGIRIEKSYLLNYSNKQKIYSSIKEVFYLVNSELNTSIDSILSGSTCCSLFFTGEQIISSNVGDSRAIIGKRRNDKWSFINITTDHKPDLPIEKMRILQFGGRVESHKDEKGNFIGPNRVWLKDENLPGLAMSRSFGDQLAASVGTTCEPEIYDYDLEHEDKFLFVASDGVWEFLSSLDILNIIKDYYDSNDSKACCEYILKQSSNIWINKEGVIDDISMILLFFD